MKPFYSRFPLNPLLAAGLALAAGLVPASPATADSVAFGPAGEVYRLRQGAAGEFFGAAAADPAAPALALDTTSPVGATTRIVLPGTDDGRLEDQPGLIFDEASRTLILHWLSRGQDGAAFRFASFDGELSPVGTLATANGETPLLFATDPQFASTRDAFAVQLMNGQVIVAHRAVLHLAWRDAGSGRARYAPVTFVEGQWVGWSEAFDLSGIVRSRLDPADFIAASGPLAEYLSLRADEARRAAAITFGDGLSGRLSELEVRFQPMSLEQVGERVRNRFFRQLTLYKPSGDLENDPGDASFSIVGLGQQGLGTETLTALVDGLRRGLIQIEGFSCGPGEPSTVYLGIAGIGKDGVLGLPSQMPGEMLHVALLGDDPDQLESLVGGAGFTIVGLGSVGCAVAGDSQTLVQLGQGGEILHVDLTGRRLALDAANAELFGSSNGQRQALVETSGLWLRNEASAPVIAGTAAARVLVGPSTGEFLAAWADGEQLRYGRTERGIWRDTATVPLSEELGFEQTVELLRKNLR